MEIVRHYNSAYSAPAHPNGVLGRGWRLSYETELVDRLGKIQVLQADGGRVIFDRDRNNPTGCSTRNPANGTMRIGRQLDGQTDYTWTWTDGRILHFNVAGKLDRIKAASGEVLRLMYDNQNVLVRVIDPQGRSLNLVYFERNNSNQFHGARFIDTPVGRFAYEYGSALPKGAEMIDPRQLLANLVRVRLPDSFEPDTKAHALSSRGTTRSTTSRIYHHEDPLSPWLMTGISIEAVTEGGKLTTTRYATYGYDDIGRAILSTHASNINKVTLDMNKAGQTVLTNSLGQKTVYRYAVITGTNRLLEVRGAGCALCGEPNMRYGYDRVGRLVEVTKLSEVGEPVTAIRSQRDKLGRVTRISKVTYIHGEAGVPQLQVRFSYQGNAFVPVVIARPSVVPDAEFVTHIEYNQAEQPLSVTDSGWTPTYDGKQAAGRIERTTRYGYVTINGRSLLSEIDGPLANGKTNSPADSDVTRLEYDHQNAPRADKAVNALTQYTRLDGLLTRIIAPGNFTTELLERDAAQRPTKLRTINGDIVQETSITNDWRSAPQHVEVTAGGLRRTLDYEYDRFGQIAAVTMPGNLRTVFRHDNAGQPILTVLPDGSGIRSEHDTEGRVVHTTRLLDALAPRAPSLGERRFDYNSPTEKPSRLVEVDDAAGLLKRYIYDDLGRLVSTRTALGITTMFDYNENGLLAHRTDAAGSSDAASIGLTYDTGDHTTGITAGNGVKTRRLYDDFGRKVMEADPDRGVMLFRHDAVGHVVARIDETMVATRFAYDHADRLVTMGADNKLNLVRYRYRGSQLINTISTPDGNVQHATERTDYERDAFGRVLKETRWLANVAPRAGTPSGFTFITTSAYDDAGRIVGQILPDGHRLHYRYASASISKANVRPGQLEAILFDNDFVVSNIEQTIAGGMTGYTMGNGMRQKISFDAMGRIASLQTLAPASDNWWRQIQGWFVQKGTRDSAVYRQFNTYDDDGRLVYIQKEMLSFAKSGSFLTSQNDRYGYDQLSRVTSMSKKDEKTIEFTYDKGGNRTTEMVGENDIQRTYHYGSENNRLIAITEKNTTVPKLLRNAWLYHPSGVQLAQIGWNKSEKLNDRHVVYNTAKRPIAIYDNDKLIARYYYNIQGERVGKTVYTIQPNVKNVSQRAGDEFGETTYMLYRDKRIVAETDSNARITSHYIYLFGMPVAKVEIIKNNSFIHRLRMATMPYKSDDISDGTPYIYCITNDHLGTPQQITDENRQLFWQAKTSAFGNAQVTYAATNKKGTMPFLLNLRLPGQFFDVETGLNYNYQRDYDPEVGHYTAPDPAGLDAGLYPYTYVSNNPLMNIDPLGLFQSDIHYYMTFFLAIVAGVEPEEAKIIALAAQYIDDNPDTSPLNVSLTTGLTDDHRARLLTYHFTMISSTINPGSGMVSGMNHDLLQYGLPPKDPRYTNIPENAQLKNLSAAVTTAGQALNLDNPRCTQLQFFGEYLHAFEDTFAHRDFNDIPFSLNNGLGHGIYGSNPDFTYNHKLPSGTRGNTTSWNTNEARTLESEKEVFSKMAAWSNSGKAKNISDIEQILKNFNSIHEAEKGGESTEAHQKGYPTKIKILQNALITLGYSDIDITKDSAYGFNTRQAAANRINFLHDKDGNLLDQQIYRGTILPK